MPLTYTIKDAAERLGVSKRWLQKFLRKHPADNDGVPFYVPFGNRKKLTERDLERILEMNRNSEKEKLLSAHTIVPSDWSHSRVYEDSEMMPERPLSDRLARALVLLKK